MKTYYDILEIPSDASSAAITSSFRRLALRYHPDKVGPGREAGFKEISAAYEVLSDPLKRHIYDRYGEVGLRMLSNNVKNPSALNLLIYYMIYALCYVLFILTPVMLLVFFGFLCGFVDNHLNPLTWNFVKVFSPLFVICVMVGIIAFINLLRKILAENFKELWLALFFLSAVALIIFIPIVKDCNDARHRKNSMSGGGSMEDYLQWRVWLTPGYLLTFFLLVGIILNSPAPAVQSHHSPTSMYGTWITLQQYFDFIFWVLETLCIVAFFVLVAFRADECITTDYFLVIGAPCFVCTGLILVNIFLRQLLALLVQQNHNKSEEVEEATQDNAPGDHVSKAGKKINGRREQKPSTEYVPSSAHVTSPSTTHAGDNDPVLSATGTSRVEQPTTMTEENNATSDARRQTGILSFLCIIIAQLLGVLLFLGPYLATVCMVCVRLNYHAKHGNYNKVLSLLSALIPLYILWGGIFIVVFTCFVLDKYDLIYLSNKAKHPSNAPETDNTRTHEPNTNTSKSCLSSEMPNANGNANARDTQCARGIDERERGNVNDVHNTLNPHCSNLRQTSPSTRFLCDID